MQHMYVRVQNVLCKTVQVDLNENDTLAIVTKVLVVFLGLSK